MSNPSAPIYFFAFFTTPSFAVTMAHSGSPLHPLRTWLLVYRDTSSPFMGLSYRSNTLVFLLEPLRLRLFPSSRLDQSLFPFGFSAQARFQTMIGSVVLPILHCLRGCILRTSWLHRNHRVYKNQATNYAFVLYQVNAAFRQHIVLQTTTTPIG